MMTKPQDMHSEKNRRIIDLTVPLYHGMPVWPSSPEIGILSFPLEHWSGTLLVMYVHTATHLDAQRHYPAYKELATIDDIPLETLIGEAVVIKLKKKAKARVDINDLKPYENEISRVKRVIISTGWYKKFDGPQGPDYYTEFPEFTTNLAKWLVTKGVRLIAIDTPSPSLSQDGPLHEILLGSGVALVENLTNVDQIRKRKIQLVVLPLSLKGRGGRARQSHRHRTVGV